MCVLLASMTSFVQGGRAAGGIGRRSFLFGGGGAGWLGRVLGRQWVYRVRLTLWWSKKAEWVKDGEGWGPMAVWCVGPRRKWSMEEAVSREGGSNQGGREAVGHVNRGNAECRIPPFRECVPQLVCRSPPTMATALGWALVMSRMSSAVVWYRARECLKNNKNIKQIQS